MKKKQRTKAQIAADAKRTGRPPKPPEDVRENYISLRVTKSERALLDKEAARLGVTITDLLLRPWRQRKGTK